MNRQARVSPQVDLEHPWLGLESFSESTRAYFFGREAEAAELLQRLRLNPLLVLYGRSGLGKTSLLRARLVPDLVNLGFRPAFYRITYRKGEDLPLKQLLVVLEALGPIDVPGCKLPDDPASRLWLHFHQREGKERITHLILDQFEEIFTLGAQRPGAGTELRQLLAMLVQGAIPAPVESLLDDSEAFLKHFQLNVPPLPVLLSLRQDYVFALNRWRSQLPGLGQNSFELGELGIDAAIAAVFKPGELRCRYRGEVAEENEADTGLPPIITKETAERIVRFVARKHEDLHVEDVEAVPPILSLLCQELNLRRFPQPAGAEGQPVAQITFGEDASGVETIIADFYDRCLAGRPEGVRIFIEEKLVSGSGARLQHDEKSMLKVFAEGCEIPLAAGERRAAGYGDAAKARACLEDLVNQRLLTSVGGGGNPGYELIHDLLAHVVQKSRTAREERYEKEQADRRAEADKKAKEDAEARAQAESERAQIQAHITRRARFFAGVAIVVALIAIGACYLALRARSEADRQRREALAQKTAADGQRREALAQKAEAERQRGEAEKQQAAAVTARTSAQESRKNYVAAKRDAEELIKFMRYDLRDLGTVGRLDMMESINARILKYHEDHPGDSLREQAVSLGQRGDILRDEGKLEAALKSYRDSLAIFEKLTKQEPGNAGLQRDLSVSYNNVGYVQREQGDLAGALKSYRDSLAIREELAKQEPGNAVLQRDLSVSYNKVGDVQRAQRDLAGALKSYRDSLAIFETLAKQEPRNAGLQRDLSVSYDKVGDVQGAQGDLAGALKSYHDSLAIRQTLAKQDPRNAGWQRDLSVSYNKVGDVQSAESDLAGALKSYRDSLAIAEELAKQDPGNAGWQDDLAVSYWRTGTTLARLNPKSKKDARTMVEKGRDILRALKTRTGLTPQQQQELDSIEADL